MTTRLPTGWQLVAIRRLTLEIERGNPATLFKSTFNYIDISSVNNEAKTISTEIGRDSQDAPSRARQLVQGGDVVVSTVRPRLNTVALVPNDLESVVASTGFCVLRANQKIILSEYLFLFCTSTTFVSQLVARERGASYPAVTDEDVLETQIPVPPLSEQRRIVGILNEARDIRRLRNQADDLTTQLIPAIFDEMFGELVQDTERTTLGEISAEVKYGTSKASSDSGFVTLRIPNVIGDSISYEDLVSVPLETDEAARYTLQDGDLLFVRTNGNPEYIGRSGVFDSSLARRNRLEANNIIFASYLIRVRLKPGTLNPYYVAAYLRTPHGRADVMRQAKTSAGQFNINTQGLKSLSIPMFSDKLQSEFLNHVMEVEELKRSKYAESDKILKQLDASLLAYAFSGELTADWRKANREVLARESEDRDLWLRKNGIKLTIPDDRARDSLKITDERLAELAREQRILFEQIQNLDQNESGGTFTLSSLVKKLEEPLDSLSVDAVRRHLDVLASLGLIKAISQRAGGGGSVGLAFGNAYRLPRTAKVAMADSLEPDLVKPTEQERLTRIGKKTLRNREAFEFARAVFDENDSTNPSEGD